MRWQEIINNPILRNLPFKVETNQWGQIVMHAAASNKHAKFQSRIDNLLEKISNTGETLTECSVETSKGVKVPDVVWASDAFIEKYGFETPFPEVPEICVEVISPSNKPAEMKEKKELYFEGGAKEFWLCDDAGNMQFWNHEGEFPQSLIFPDFPTKIKLRRY